MPTGYTASVQSGETTEFREFALQCARAFGACITMRDDPHDAAIPQEFKPSSYYETALAEARQELVHLQAMTDRDVARAADADYETAVEGWKKRRREKEEQRARYETMLAKAQAWEPPTPDHQGLKDFMVKQLAESIDWDCSIGDWDKMPTRKTEAAWRAEAIESAERSVARDTKAHAEEVARANGRTDWVKALRSSL